VTTHPRIASGREWIFYVRHESSGAWSFLPVNHERASSRCRISIQTLLAIDPSISKVLRLRRGWHAYRQSAREHWNRSRIPSGPTRLLTCEAISIRGTDDRGQFGGAFVQIWIRGRQEATARRIAAKLLRDAHWRRITEIAHQVLSRAEVHKSHRQYFDQVQIDGEVMVFFVFPTEDALTRE
jgi:hypothetical protein